MIERAFRQIRERFLMVGDHRRIYRCGGSVGSGGAVIHCRVGCDVCRPGHLKATRCWSACLDIRNRQSAGRHVVTVGGDEPRTT